MHPERASPTEKFPTQSPEFPEEPPETSQFPEESLDFPAHPVSDPLESDRTEFGIIVKQQGNRLHRLAVPELIKQFRRAEEAFRVGSIHEKDDIICL